MPAIRTWQWTNDFEIAATIGNSFGVRHRGVEWLSKWVIQACPVPPVWAAASARRSFEIVSSSQMSEVDEEAKGVL